MMKLPNAGILMGIHPLYGNHFMIAQQPSTFSSIFAIRWCFLWASLWSIGFSLGSIQGVQAQPIELPDMGSSAENILSPQAAQKLGAAFMRQVRQRLTLLEDPLILAYVQSLGTRLVQRSTLAGQPFTFFIVQDRTINAFAAPGGYIGLHTGLFIATQSESELAGVLAHEIAHITQNHLARSIESAQQMNIPMAMALVAALLLGGNNPAAGQAALAAVTAGSTQYQINFTREHEQEADSVGIELLRESQLDPQGMQAFFARLQQSSQYSGQEAPEFLRTHPITTNRIAEAQARASQYPYQQIPDSLGYRLAHARLRSLLYEQPAQAVQEFKQRLAQKQYRSRLAEQYGYAVSLYRAQQWPLAQAQINTLLAEQPETIEFIHLAGQIKQAAGDYAAAKAIYQAALKHYPQNPLLTQAYLETLLANQEAAIAYPIALELSHQSPEPAVYQQLALICHQLKRTAEAHAYQAEYYYLQNDLSGAIHQLEIALAQPNTDTLLTIRWRARLAVFKQEWLRESKKESPF